MSKDTADVPFEAKQALSIQEISKRHGICPDTVYAEFARGRLRKSKIGRRTVVFRDDYENWRRLCAQPKSVGSLVGRAGPKNDNL